MSDLDGQNTLLDIHFAEFLAKRSSLSGNARDEFAGIVTELSAAMGAGHSCLPISKDQKTLLKKTDLVSENKKTPLIVHNQHLYLHRYFTYESRLARQTRDMATISHPKGLGAELLDFYFGTEEGKSSVNWQRNAARVALEKDLSIISGGPGTGKTTTVVKIIGILLQALNEKLSIALAAPTGKAAMRLQESINSSLTTIDFPKEINAAIPTEAKTLHRLLGVLRNSPQFRHNNENPMGWDIVVVDEASMVDLAMMSKLVDALKPGSKLILIGDKDQLSSVESGAVLADFIQSLPQNTVELKKTYRFDSGIKELAASINQGNAQKAWSLLKDKKIANVGLVESDISGLISKRYGSYMKKAGAIDEYDMDSVFAAFNQFQILCSVHYGERGVDGINRKTEFLLAGQGFDCSPDSWYAGKPVLITRNDYTLGLYNGDIGICLLDTSDHRLKVWFETDGGGYKSYLPYRLPYFETAFAITIHKSQGSEFSEVLVVLPTEDNRVLCRELLYTAVTRAKEKVKIGTEREVFELGLSRRIERFSGLAGQLQSNS